MGTSKNFFEVSRKLGHAPVKMFASPILEGYDGEVGGSPVSIPLVAASNTDWYRLASTLTK